MEIKDNQKYLKYKKKYLNMKLLQGGYRCPQPVQNHDADNDENICMACNQNPSAVKVIPCCHVLCNLCIHRGNINYGDRCIVCMEKIYDAQYSLDYRQEIVNIPVWRIEEPQLENNSNSNSSNNESFSNEHRAAQESNNENNGYGSNNRQPRKRSRPIGKSPFNYNRNFNNNNNNNN